MTFKKGFVVSIVSFALSASAFAMSHREDGRHDHGNYHPIAYREHRDHDHDRDDRRPRGWDKGRKEGWHGGSLPPGQARKHRRDWDHDRDHDRYRRVRHHRRDWDRDHERDRRVVAQRPPVLTGTTPISQTNRNRTWGDNVRAQKAQVKTQQAQKQQPYIKH